MTDTPETSAAWDAVSRMPNGMYDSQVPIRMYATAMYDHSEKMERERDEKWNQADTFLAKLGETQEKMIDAIRERDVALDRLVRILKWAEKEQAKAWNQWIKDAPKSQLLIARSEAMRDVAKKIKREIRGLSLPNAIGHPPGEKGNENE